MLDVQGLALLLFQLGVPGVISVDVNVHDPARQGLVLVLGDQVAAEVVFFRDVTDGQLAYVKVLGNAGQEEGVFLICHSKDSRRFFFNYSITPGALTNLHFLNFKNIAL